MTNFDTDKIKKVLVEKWGNKSCPMCNNNNWNIQDRCFQLMQYNKGSMVVGGPVIPIIPVTCTNCGNTVLVNAIVNKLIE